ncbi:VWFA domain-containing protein [Salix suchowensis]|nr:VWFA domain-containing protein [Salix suchowensis]
MGRGGFGVFGGSGSTTRHPTKFGRRAKSPGRLGMGNREADGGWCISWCKDRTGGKSSRQGAVLEELLRCPADADSPSPASYAVTSVAWARLVVGLIISSRLAVVTAKFVSGKSSQQLRMPRVTKVKKGVGRPPLSLILTTTTGNDGRIRLWKATVGNVWRPAGSLGVEQAQEDDQDNRESGDAPVGCYFSKVFHLAMQSSTARGRNSKRLGHGGTVMVYRASWEAQGERVFKVRQHRVPLPSFFTVPLGRALSRATMPKSTTKATGKATKPITDFFTRRPRTISHDSYSQPSQSPKRALNPSNTKKNSKDRIRDQGVNAMPALKVDIPTRPVASLPTPLPDSEPGHRSTRNATKPKPLHSHNERALGLGLPVTSSQSTTNDKTTLHTAVKPSGKRKKNIDDDSDNEHQLDSMITVIKRPTNKAKAHTFILTPPIAKVNVAPALVTPPISHKRPRLLSPEPSSIVPSSQSDEMEVDVSRLSIREVDVVKDSVDKWRQDPQLVSIEALQNREASVPATLLASEDDHHSVVSGSSATSLPRSSPGEISARTSNTSVIDDDCITDVYAGSLTPPPSSPRAAPSTKAPVALSGEAKATQIIADIKARCEASRESSEERVLRDFKDNLDLDSDPEELLINPIRQGKGKATGRPSAGSRRVENPLDALLKEKKNAEKKGKGADALRAAETAVAGKRGLLAEMDEEDPAWQDEGAAFSALKYRDRLERDLSSDGANDDHEMGEEDQQRLFGRKCSKSIKVILDEDKGKAVDTESESKPFGIPLWLDATDQMKSSPRYPNLPLRTTILSGLKRDHPRLGLSAYLALSRLWSGPLQSATVLPVSVLYSALDHLGADPAILLKAGWHQWTPVVAYI